MGRKLGQLRCGFLHASNSMLCCRAENLVLVAVTTRCMGYLLEASRFCYLVLYLHSQSLFPSSMLRHSKRLASRRTNCQSAFWSMLGSEVVKVAMAVGKYVDGSWSPSALVAVCLTNKWAWQLADALWPGNVKQAPEASVSCHPGRVVIRWLRPCLEVGKLCYLGFSTVLSSSVQSHGTSCTLMAGMHPMPSSTCVSFEACEMYWGWLALANHGGDAPCWIIAHSM